MRKIIYKLLGVTDKYLDRQRKLLEEKNFWKTAKGEFTLLILVIYSFSFVLLFGNSFFGLSAFVFSLLFWAPLLYLIYQDDLVAAYLAGVYFTVDKFSTTYILLQDNTSGIIHILVASSVSVIIAIFFWVMLGRIIIVNKELIKNDVGRWMLHYIVYALAIVIIIFAIIGTVSMADDYSEAKNANDTASTTTEVQE